MKNSHLAIAVCLSLGGLTACTTNHRADAASPQPKDVVARVNGKAIGRSALAAQAHGSPSDAQRIDELVARELLRQEAEKMNINSDPALAESYDNALRMALSQVAAEHFMKTTAISDEEAKQAYQEKVSGVTGTEYKARHILVDNEASARSLIAKLNKGADFAALAKANSKDPGSKDKGGDLGWFAANQMIEPFAKAVASMKSGETTAAPVKTQFGWHVIQLEDSRAQQPPPFEDVKPQVVQMLQTKKLREHMEALRKNAKVEVTATPAAPDAAGTPAVKQ